MPKSRIQNQVLLMAELDPMFGVLSVWGVWVGGMRSDVAGVGCRLREKLYRRLAQVHKCCVSSLIFLNRHAVITPEIRDPFQHPFDIVQKLCN